MKKLLIALVVFIFLLPWVVNAQPTGGTSISSPVDRGGTIGNTAVLSTGKIAVKKFAYTTNSAGDASTLNFASHNMQVGDWVYWRVGGEERQIVARTATSVTVSPPFSSAPGNSASIHWYRTALPKFVYESGVSNANGGFVGSGGMYDDGAGSITWTPFATNATGYQYVNGQITSPLAIVSPNHNGVATDTMVGEKLISTHALTNSSTTTSFALGSVTTEDVYAGDIAEIYITATGKNLQRTKIGSFAASGSSAVSALPADALYYTPDNTYSIRILRRQGLRTANSAPGSTDFAVVVREAGNPAVAQSGTWTVTANGAIAHDGVDSGNPLKIGGRARTSDFTAVSNDDRTDALFDKNGKIIPKIGCLPENEFSGTSGSDITGTSSTSVVSAAGAGIKYAVYCIGVSNMNASTTARVDLQDGTTTKWTCPAAAAGGGCAFCSSTPIFTGTANTALQAQSSAAANIRVSYSGCKVP